MIWRTLLNFVSFSMFYFKNLCRCQIMGPDPAATTTQMCLCGAILVVYDHCTKLICQQLVRSQGSCSGESQCLFHLVPMTQLMANVQHLCPHPLPPAPAPAAWVLHADSKEISAHPFQQHPGLTDHGHPHLHSSTPFWGQGKGQGQDSRTAGQEVLLAPPQKGTDTHSSWTQVTPWQSPHL